MTGTSPSLSIIIPTYNRAELVAHAVRSALDAEQDELLDRLTAS